MTQQEYIHITEAVKKWKKTRQTFYNYIHKGLVRTKKINNKVYLYNDDVQQLMDGFLPTSVEPTQVSAVSEAQNEDVPEVEKQITLIPKEIKQIQDDMLRLHKQYYTLKDDMFIQLDRAKQEILLENKQQQALQKESIIAHMHQLQPDALSTGMKKLQGIQKKQYFWIGYCAFVFANLLCITYLI